MSAWEELMALVGFGVDEEERVWMWTDDPSSVGWVVTVRQRWRGVETVETPRRHLGVELSWFETLEWTPGHSETGWGGSFTAFSGWRVERDRIVGIEIDLGDGRVLRVP